jgi:hypothetical protein
MHDVVVKKHKLTLAKASAFGTSGHSIMGRDEESKCEGCPKTCVNYAFQCSD